MSEETQPTPVPPFGAQPPPPEAPAPQVSVDDSTAADAPLSGPVPRAEAPTRGTPPSGTDPRAVSSLGRPSIIIDNEISKLNRGEPDSDGVARKLPEWDLLPPDGMVRRPS
jgi:hypothetical protein